MGRLIEKKGYADLITACGRLRDQGLAFHCRIVGEGPLESELRAQIQALRLSDQVELTGPLPMPEIIRRLTEETQVFALACATESDGGMDNLPTVLMEAMAAGLPCVSTRLAGVPEMVLHEKTGLLAEERQPEELARHLARLLGDPALCETLGSAGREHARAHFAQAETSRHLLRTLARYGQLRGDAELHRRHPGLAALQRRQWLGRLTSAQLRLGSTKVRGKDFDLTRFMAG